MSNRDRVSYEDGDFRPYQPSQEIINKFEENAFNLGVPNPYTQARPIIDAISYLLETAPLSLEALPEIENPFRTDLTEVGLDAVSSLNNLGAQITGGDLLSNTTNPSPFGVPFEQQNIDQKLASGKKAGFGKPGDITFGS
jgi:hypothetical protein